MNIFVANIERKVSDEKLLELFQEFGEVSSLKLIKDRDTGVSKGYAFVEMPNADEAQKAIDALNKTELEGRALAVNEARPKEEYKKPSGGGYKGGHGGGGGYNRGGGGGYNKGGYGGGDGGYKKRY
ncbi:MAG TPA: RNA-binding protein [Chitinophagales bacterium]|nr:RNA-binding protein [Chitinophagales bacterium]HNM31891.1 RNA-binding protein [Chitinophagales bacterium]